MKSDVNDDLPVKRMASVCRVEMIDDQFVPTVIEEGMSRDEICSWCPPVKKARGNYDYNLRDVLRWLITEEFDLVGSAREPGNVRHFWYTNVLKTLTEVLQVENSSNVIESTLSQVWRELVISGRVSYSGMNIISGKQRNAYSNIVNSDCPNVIIGIEKESYFEAFKWMGDLFRCHFITAGGMPSRAVTNNLAENLAEQGMDLSQKFHMIGIADFDPGGMFISNMFAQQLREAGLPDVQNTWAVLNADQITDTFVEAYSVPCKDKNAESTQAKKAEATKYKSFADGTNGGLLRDGKPYKIELDSVGEKLIKGELLRTISLIIDAPYALEHSRILDYLDEQREHAKSDLLEEIDRSEIVPVVGEYLEPVDNLIDEIKEQADQEIEDIEEAKTEKCTEEQAKWDRLENAIWRLRAKQQGLETEMREKTEAEDAAIRSIESDRDEEIQQLYNFKQLKEAETFANKREELSANVSGVVDGFKADYEDLKREIDVPEIDWNGYLQDAIEHETGSVEIEWPGSFAWDLRGYIGRQCRDSVSIPDLGVESIEEDLWEFCEDNDISEG